MSVTFSPAPLASGEEQVVLRRISWDVYERLNDELVEGKSPRMIYCDGALTIMTKSREHDWYGERLSQLVVALAEGLEILWEDAGQATFRRKEINVGLEGDKTFYLGEHAEFMIGPGNIDLSVQPPPDLAIEVEVSHPADAAMVAWGRLGVVEVWRYDPVSDEFGFRIRQDDGTYAQFEQSAAFPTLRAMDVLEQMRLASKLGAAKWHIQVRDWVQKVIKPRQKGG